MRHRFLSPLPKYDFQEPLNSSLEVKINGTLNTKSWIRGKELAANGCCQVALRMALDTYLRTCFVKGTDDHSIDDAVRVLTEMGYAEDEIREAAKDSYFSVFFYK
ncbi:UBA domain-containing protein [Chitinophaga cymbidii]|uniref:Uncharacterized protein n=1 Tax=Chitinophaga cymbidii TaxID=1096750 RepID=A0A512RIL9_9BACT|nr:hypothetical protein [Chitinophaga cymbidii]GEP95549.1 hypothetical protein CCY01nite_18090 [Chitinophaga cymbidii]